MNAGGWSINYSKSRDCVCDLCTRHSIQHQVELSERGIPFGHTMLFLTATEAKEMNMEEKTMVVLFAVGLWVMISSSIGFGFHPPHLRDKETHFRTTRFRPVLPLPPCTTMKISELAPSLPSLSLGNSSRSEKNRRVRWLSSTHFTTHQLHHPVTSRSIKMDGWMDDP
ncbi:hypothetical protein OPV22_002130 [Ensete ventricosum]|uniref:Uncharacterized protein n=1 Tax=Ensete ventricosum TaxID=4639 RepID=A0AAV8RX15_ENSVE|nr:hypothetical protein OPV22_002130 [Ensete ventricosum]